MIEQDKSKESDDITRWVSEDILDKLGFTKIPRDFPGELPERAYESFTEPVSTYIGKERFRRDVYFGSYCKKTKSCTMVFNSRLEGTGKDSSWYSWYVANVYVPKFIEGLWESRIAIFIISRELLREKYRVKPEKLEETLLELYKKHVDKDLKNRLKKRWEKFLEKSK